MFGDDAIEYEDTVFGLFKFDRLGYQFETRTRWLTKEVSLRLTPDDDDCNKAPSEALHVAHSLWGHQDEWNTKILNGAVAKLLKLKNDNWLQQDEREIAPELFKSKMELTTIAVNLNGNFEFWFNDGDLFWGHSIMVEGNLKEGPTKAGIHG